MNFMTFHSVGNFIIPTDFHSIIFQRGRAEPPTSMAFNQPHGAMATFWRDMGIVQLGIQQATCDRRYTLTNQPIKIPRYLIIVVTLW